MRSSPPSAARARSVSTCSSRRSATSAPPDHLAPHSTPRAARGHDVPVRARHRPGRLRSVRRSLRPEAGGAGRVVALRGGCDRSRDCRRASQTMLAFRFLMGVAAASPRAMSLTIARDRFSGDAIMCVVSLVMLVFQPSAVVPSTAGEGLLVVGSWQVIFGFTVVMALLTMFWTTRFRRTCSPAAVPAAADVRPNPCRVRRRSAARRWALGHGLVLMFEFTALTVHPARWIPSSMTCSIVVECLPFSFAIGVLFEAAGEPDCPALPCRGSSGWPGSSSAS